MPNLVALALVPRCIRSLFRNLDFSEDLAPSSQRRSGGVCAVVARNYLHAGSKPIHLAELGRCPSSLHRAIYRRLEAFITVSDTPGELPLPPGRAGPEFIARIFDLENFAERNGVGHVKNYEDGIVGCPDRINPVDRYVPDEPYTPFAPYHSLVADRLKITGTGSWTIADFLQDELWLPYLEPSVLALEQRPAVGPSFKHESREENLKLAKIWDARGLLAVFCEKPRFRCRVCGAHKSTLVSQMVQPARVPFGGPLCTLAKWKLHLFTALSSRASSSWMR